MNGWIHDFYVAPDFHFTYYGFSWVKTLGDPGMYILFGALVLSSMGIIFGAFYRLSTVIFFLGFTYVELIDKTTYLNHYYFVSIIAFLMMFLPANKHYSVDLKWRPYIGKRTIPRWMIDVLLIQVSIVYIYAGLAKINHDWLIEAEPLKTWLKPKYDTPLLGELFRYEATHYFFSWFGMIYDCTIPFFLLWGRTRYWAYVVVIVFHVLTAYLFPIGVFPYVMILSTLIFFPAGFHQKLLNRMPYYSKKSDLKNGTPILNPFMKKLVFGLFVVHLFFQIIIPWRYILYSGNLFWTEEGYRFSWRVMLVEKTGMANFYLKHPDYPGMRPINNLEHLTPQQIKQMSFQPDMILQYAHHLKKVYTDKVFIEGTDTIVLDEPEIHAEVFVKMNGYSSRKMIDKKHNLAVIQYNLKPRKFINSFHE
jgi:hypothetical protein